MAWLRFFCDVAQGLLKTRDSTHGRSARTRAVTRLQFSLWLLADSVRKADIRQWDHRAKAPAAATKSR
jgi:hypothetical protein